MNKDLLDTTSTRPVTNNEQIFTVNTTIEDGYANIKLPGMQPHYMNNYHTQEIEYMVTSINPPTYFPNVFLGDQL